jgi:hypothetical protein
VCARVCECLQQRRAAAAGVGEAERGGGGGSRSEGGVGAVRRSVGSLSAHVNGGEQVPVGRFAGGSWRYNRLASLRSSMNS